MTSLLHRLRDRTEQAVLSGTIWVPVADAGARSQQWLGERRVFALEVDGALAIPAYAFDAEGVPVPALRDVLAVFSDMPPSRVASWFESRSSALNGQRPRELLQSDPEAVVAAAQAHLQGPVHG